LGRPLGEDLGNRIASRRIATKLGETSLKAPTFATSDDVSIDVQSEAAAIGGASVRHFDCTRFVELH